MKRVIAMTAVLAVLLSGCSSWMDASHVTVRSHQAQISNIQSGSVSARDYTQLQQVMMDLVDAGAESSVINVAEYDQEKLEIGLRRVADYICEQYPLGAFAVDSVNFEVGTGGGQPAVSVSIDYIHGRSVIRQIVQVAAMEQAKEVIYDTLESCGEGLVLMVDSYSEADIAQIVEDYAQMNPQSVMELPQVSVGVYPDMGSSRVLELKFTYQSSRGVLRQMQTQVRRVFTSAVYYITSDGTEAQKYAQLYTFLMERFDYKLETSITPSYSLLIHGVGDSKAFAVAYSAMCRQAELECQIVTGTRNGEPWCWNLICQDGVYYHVDLLDSYEKGSMELLTGEKMEGYVWDYSAYPES